MFDFAIFILNGLCAGGWTSLLYVFGLVFSIYAAVMFVVFGLFLSLALFEAFICTPICSLGKVVYKAYVKWNA